MDTAASSASDGTERYPWYELVQDGLLEQGDLLSQFPLYSLPSLGSPDEPGSTVVDDYDIVILTQSCDLGAGKVDNVLVCPVFSAESLADQISDLGTPKGREKIRRGSTHSIHMLPPCEFAGFDGPCRVVNFR